jgi:hypothetical protein
VTARSAGTDGGAGTVDLPVRVRPPWLRLREPADAAARSPELVAELRPYLALERPVVVHDLGCGTGSMGRWLAPQLDGQQHWVLHDRDPDLLAHAAAALPVGSADGDVVTVETRLDDVTRLGPDDLRGASLLTASALLDMMTADELDRFVDTCGAARCPVLVTLSVVGRVELTPSDPVDDTVAEAFNNHQRRTTGGRTLLGPDAVAHAADAFAAHGFEVLLRPSPWSLGPEDSALTMEWLTGWVGAACEQRPELVAATVDYTPHRVAAAAMGRLDVTLHHLDLLALP